jgi:hypothetical protein
VCTWVLFGLGDTLLKSPKRFRCLVFDLSTTAAMCKPSGPRVLRELTNSSRKVGE